MCLATRASGQVRTSWGSRAGSFGPETAGQAAQTAVAGCGSCARIRSVWSLRAPCVRWPCTWVMEAAARGCVHRVRASEGCRVGVGAGDASPWRGSLAGAAAGASNRELVCSTLGRRQSASAEATLGSRFWRGTDVDSRTSDAKQQDAAAQQCLFRGELCGADDKGGSLAHGVINVDHGPCSTARTISTSHNATKSILSAARRVPDKPSP